MAGKRARGSNNSGKEMSPSSAKVISPALDVPIIRLELKVEEWVSSGATASDCATSAPPDKAFSKSNVDARSESASCCSRVSCNVVPNESEGGKLETEEEEEE